MFSLSLPLPNTQNPPFHPGDCSLRPRQIRIEKPHKLTVNVGLAQARGSRVGIVLVCSLSVHGVGVFPQGGIDLDHGRAACRELPAVERSGNEKPWSMPTSVGTSSARRTASHSAMPRRVQYLRGLGGGKTSSGGEARSAR